MNWVKKQIRKITWKKTKDELVTFFLSMTVWGVILFFVPMPALTNVHLKPLMPIVFIVIWKTIGYLIKK